MDRVGIFARCPISGAVKTRLSPALPAALALDLYTAMLADAIESARGSEPGSLTLFWASDPAQATPFPVPPGITIRRQLGADLGGRLSAAFADLVSSPEDRALVIGADCPDLAPNVIREAFAALDQHDVVLGPTHDGGYYLVGLRRPAPALFSGVSWGTGTVLAQTLERAGRTGLSVELLGTLGDIDTPEDLVRFVARRSVSAIVPGARTETALREMGLLPPRS